MTKNQRNTILQYGRDKGISKACRKFGISRTIYYRWKKRYEKHGIDGLVNISRSFIPVNKLDCHTEEILFKIVAEHPDYGPVSLRWLLEKEGVYASASGIYNILKRNSISRRAEREAFSRRYRNRRHLPVGYKPESGEVWLGWTEELKGLLSEKRLFLYSIMDVCSGTACARLYTEKSISHCVDILSGLAIPIARELHMKPRFIITPADDIYGASGRNENHPYSCALKSIGIQQILWDIDFRDYRSYADSFTECIYEHLRNLPAEDIPDLKCLRIRLQDFLRRFNLNEYLSFGPGQNRSPLEIVSRSCKKKVNLPLWAYIDREY